MKKYKIFGTLLCATGIVFASGETIENGCIALLCMAGGVVTYKYAERLASAVASATGALGKHSVRRAA